MISRSWKIAFIIYVMFSFNSVAIASENDSGNLNDTDKISPEQKAFQNDMKLINQLMLQNEKKKQPEKDVRGVEIDFGGNPVKGSESAGLIIVEFSDYSCSHCAHYVNNIYPDIYKNYISTGKILYTVIDYPLPDHDAAIKASEAAYCAGDQGKFWEMHEALMHDQQSLNNLNTIASFIELDIKKLKNCLEIRKYNSKVKKHIFLATRLEIPSVPGFIIASIDPDNPGKARGISYIRGAKPFEIFQQEIDRALVSLGK